jgi:hypothetical protein
MITIVAGSRSITCRKTVYDACQEFWHANDVTEVVCGMAEGVDLLGRDWADVSSIPVKEFPVLPSERWAGGPNQRNQRMADYAKVSGKGALLLIWDGVSSGSVDMLKRAKKAGLYIMIVDLSQPRLF